ncbi:hypothetical protein [Faecalitalea cylindroides]|uniref:Uncharacterized protein n=1 Tax=Faecalitalea cylindroides ATCC 27803 TaxID=649755 RepID=U2PRT2_9FIRM|nr:hypothetical protein [Faecalitalea cylindroides]ERK46831.1 hypothetical protein HMPREF0367_00324 [[Eubacterium] cylindroides ATCC 27803] [Faecalitalea cylindroides ATCC 27803]
MDSRIRKSINKLEIQKQIKMKKKEKIAQELSEIDANLKQLYAFQKEQDKLQSAIDQFYKPIKEEKANDHSESIHSI